MKNLSTYSIELFFKIGIFISSNIISLYRAMFPMWLYIRVSISFTLLTILLRLKTNTE